MNVERANAVFDPIVITIETKEEAEEFYNIFNYAYLLDELHHIDYRAISNMLAQYRNSDKFYAFAAAVKERICGNI